MVVSLVTVVGQIYNMDTVSVNDIVPQFHLIVEQALQQAVGVEEGLEFEIAAEQEA